MRPSASRSLKAFSRVVGEPQSAKIEYAIRPEKVDHVWITIDSSQQLRVAINTLSLRNRDAGFDPRVRVGLIRSEYQTLPEAGVFPCAGLDYRELEAVQNVFYETYEQHALEALLMAKTERAVLVEVWGELYQQNHLGIHQVHCRRSSCAVPEELEHRDGALRFYFPNHKSEMLLFKFCGQS